MANDLRQGVLSFREVLFQGIAASAPAGAAVATMTGAAAYALGSLPLTAIVAFVLVLLNAVIINRISAHVAGAGGYYDYIKRGFGVGAGNFAGWMYAFYQVTSLSFIAMSISVFVPALLSEVYGINIPYDYWIPLYIGTALFGFFVSYGGIKGSLKYAMVMGTIEIIAVLGVSVAIIVGHPSINTGAVFTPKYASGGIAGVFLGVIFMYTAFSGFGGSTPLGEEAKDGKKMVGRAVVVASIVLGVFFVFAAYAFTVGWGPANMATYSQALVPGITLSQTLVGLGAAIIITVLYINSILTDQVVFTNSASRVIYAMSRDGILPSFLSRTHDTRKTPHVAAAFITLATIVLGLVSVPLLGGFNAFLFTGTAGTLATLVVHGMTNASLPRILQKKKIRVGLESVTLPAVTLVILGFVFYGTFISVSLPIVLAVYAFIFWAALSLIISYMKRKVSLTGNNAALADKEA